MHEKMVAAGQPPNTTTFNALISGEREECKVFQHGIEPADLALPELCHASSDPSLGVAGAGASLAFGPCSPRYSKLGARLRACTDTLAGPRCHCPAAHSKAGDLPKVLQTFEEMVSKVST